MRLLVCTLLIVLAGPGIFASAQSSCPVGQTTSVSGVVYAPNGTDPLPNVQVYIPTTAVAPFTPGVSCPVVGQPPSGTPLVGTLTGVDGSFTLTGVPVGTNIPLVIVSGRWRRQLVIPSTTACENTVVTGASMPANQSQGDIPKIAIASGSVDAVECVLRKVGIQDSEFTDQGGTGRINIFAGTNSPGAVVDLGATSETVLMGDQNVLDSYDMLMLPCQGGAYIQSGTDLANLISYANAGGRVYASHYSYVWMYDNPPFDQVANWAPDPFDLFSQNTGTATVDQSFSGGQTLAQWLQQPAIAASTTLGQIGVSTIRHDLNEVISPTQSWLTLNGTLGGETNPVLQFVFDTPIGPPATTNQCGRVLFNEYHVETNSTSSLVFPNECDPSPMTPQEKLLEYSLFELTSDGGAPTLTPASAAFGSQPVGFNSAPQTFTWTNNSTFPASATTSTTGNFSAASSNCSSVVAGASCTINVVYDPTALGPGTGILTAVSNGMTLTATLTGTGVPDLVFSPATVAFGNVDVGATVVQTVMVTNSGSGLLPLPPLVLSANYGVNSTCGSTIAALSNCSFNVTFTPTTTGPSTGSLTVNAATPANFNLPMALTGNGVDFSIVSNPGSGSVVGGIGTAFNVLTSPIAGYANTVALSCTTTAPLSTCSPASATVVPSIATTTGVSIVTTPKYGEFAAGFGRGGWLWLAGVGSGVLLWSKRRRWGSLTRAGLFVCLLAVSSLAITGCAGRDPVANPAYTPAGSYTYTVTATDGFLTHSATYALTVSVN